MTFRVQKALTNASEKLVNVVHWDENVDGAELVVWLTQMGNRIVRQESEDGYSYWVDLGIDGEPFGPGDWFVFYDAGTGYPITNDEFKERHKLVEQYLRERDGNTDGR